METTPKTFAGNDSPVSNFGSTNSPKNSPSDVAEEAKKKGEENLHRAKENFKEVKEDLRDKGASTIDHFKSTAKESAIEARKLGSDIVSKQVEKVACCFSDVETAVKGAAQKLRENNNPQLGGYADQAAAQCGRVSGYLTAHEPSELLADAERVARRHPEIVFGALVVTGLALGRFLKASKDSKQHSHERTTHYS